MISDPAFGIILSGPIAIAAIATLAIVRPALRWSLGIALAAIAAFVVGSHATDRDAQRSADNVAAELATSAAAAALSALAAPTPTMAMPFTPGEIANAKAIGPGGDVAVDAFSIRDDKERQTAGLIIDAGETLHVSGWAFVASTDSPCRAVGLLVDGKRIFPGRYGFPRPDVAAAYAAPTRLNVGYEIAAPGSLLGAGSHVARVVCVSNDVGREDDVLLRFSVR